MRDLQLFVGYAQDPLEHLGGEGACDEHEDTESQSIPPARRPAQMPTIQLSVRQNTASNHLQEAKYIAHLAQAVERKTLILVVVGSIPTVGASCTVAGSDPRTQFQSGANDTSCYTTSNGTVL